MSDTIWFPFHLIRGFFQRTKTALAKVCRLWNALATPVLYEYVQITQDSQLDSLLEAVSQSHPERTRGSGSESGRNLGRLIKRLDLLTYSLPWTQETPSSPYPPAAQLCKLAPNLVTLVGANDPRISPPPDIFFPRLENIYWVVEGYVVVRWAPFMVRFPRLMRARAETDLDGDISLGPGVTDYSHPSPIEAPSPPVWHSVREMICYENPQTVIYTTEFSRESFPNLRKVQFAYTPSPSDLGKFLVIHGENLNIIHLPYSPTLYSPCALSDLVSEIQAGSCPHLKEVRFSLTDILYDDDYDRWHFEESHLDMSQIRMSGITVIGFHYLEYLEDIDQWGFLFDTMISWKDSECFPDLQAIRILYEWEVGLVQEEYSEEFSKFLEDCKERGVDVLDDMDRSLFSIE